MKLFLDVLIHTREVTVFFLCIGIIYFQSLHLIYLTVGAVLSQIVAKTLKHIIKQPRPDTNVPNKRKSYGMPSSHSQAMGFFSGYFHQLVLFVAPQKLFGLSPSIFALLLDLATISVVWSRVYLGHHTAAQVLSGVSLGALCSIGWFHIWQAYFDM
ncbi:phosphatidic acid phosphatase type 2/haloperoxidase [Sporodiniella umbellata]|nr:phosphatidic acid phosphatase type 2/haloperoxidase [Sporodiniella umbellata]